MQRQYLLNHVETKCRHRRIPCQYCHCSFEHCYLKNHIKVCDNFLPPCPNYCGITDILHIDMGKHRKTCSLEIIQCTNGHKNAATNFADHLQNACPHRLCYCHYCNIKGEHQFIIGSHDSV